MDKLGISSKLFLIVAIPVFSFIVFSVSTILETNNKRINLNEFYEIYQTTYPANNLIEELQKEREQILLKDKKVEILAQRASTDSKLLEFMKSMRELKTDYIELLQMREKYLDFDKKIKIFREQYDKNLNVTSPEKFYDKLIEQLMFLSEFITVSSFDTKISTLASAKLNLIKTAEKSYMEKTLIIGLFSRGVFTSEDFTQFQNLLVSQQNLIDNFKYFADSKHKNLFAIKVEKGFQKFYEYRTVTISTIQKKEIVSQIREVLGYGGFIHNFKNYIVQTV